MAYLDHASAFATAGAHAVPTPWVPQAEGTSEFTALEWTVIALAQRDGISSLNAPGPLSRAFGSLFGLGRHSALADPRLEALRRIAVHAWHRGYTLPVSEMKRFLAAGFTAGQTETLLASVASQRTVRRRGRRPVHQR